MAIKHLVLFLCFLGYKAVNPVAGSADLVRLCAQPEDSESTQCIINHVSDKFDELSNQIARLNTKYELLSNQLPGLNQSTKFPVKSLIENTCELVQNDQVHNNSLPENCADIYALGYTQSGIYTIYEPILKIHISKFSSPMRRRLNAYCDMELAYGGPGWLVFQRRQDGSVNFTRHWADYRDGFGNLTGELWFGNENLALITGGHTKYELRIELGDWLGERRYSRYGSVLVRSSEFNYQLILGPLSAGDAGDSLYYHTGSYFSTIDRDNDQWNGHCAQRDSAGYWFKACYNSCLNCPYYHESHPPEDNEISWNAWHGTEYSLKFVEMKIRPVN